MSYLDELTNGMKLISLASGSISNLYKLSDNDLDALQFDMISRSFHHHYHNNNFYKDLCDCANFKPEDLKSLQDLTRIPLIPVSAYKRQDSHILLSTKLSQVEHEMRSIGTSGIPSVARRCKTTMDNGIQTTYGMYREFLGISKGAGLYFSPSPEEIPEMGMLKALNMLSGLLDTSRFMMKGEQFIPEHIVQQLNDWRGFTRHIIGPPFLIHRFMMFLAATNTKLQLDSKSLVVTLGGWKRFNGEMISRVEFGQMCEQWLGIKPTNIRDIYGLVESNLIAIEDERGIKHVSPVTRISVRDLNDLNKEVPAGKYGQLVVYDPTNLTVPGFLMTEEIVTLEPKKEDDTRSGQRMKYIMRSPIASEFGCCAVNLEKNMHELEQKNNNLIKPAYYQGAEV